MHKSNHIWFNQNCFHTSLNWIAFFVSTEKRIYTLKQIVEQNLKSCKKFFQISTWGWFITISCKYNNTLTSTNYKGVNEVSVLKYFWIFCFYVIHIKMKITVKINTSKWKTLHFMLFSTTAKRNSKWTKVSFEGYRYPSENTQNIYNEGPKRLIKYIIFQKYCEYLKHCHTWRKCALHFASLFPLFKVFLFFAYWKLVL